jgi:nucleotide-binding universal stress UspA family protein
MFKRVLIPTDGSKLARKAIRAGVRLAKKLGARVTGYTALEAMQPYVYTDGYILDASLLKDVEERGRKLGRKHLAEVAKAAKAARVRCDLVMTKPATAAQGIIDAARKKRCDVIFMASHGRGELATLVLGSVTQKVLARSRIPVLVFR